jgi:hypothetical protein
MSNFDISAASPSSPKVLRDAWRWFGSAAHFICGSDCRFHMATLIGEYVVSTVGEYLPDSEVREILAQSRGVALEGRGDYRRADWMKKVGFEEIGYQRKYETMVFKWTGAVCEAEGCLCGLPSVDPSELDMEGYNTAGDAARGHLALCEKWAGL